MSDEQVVHIRDSLHAFADALVSDFVKMPKKQRDAWLQKGPTGIEPTTLASGSHLFPRETGS